MEQTLNINMVLTPDGKGVKMTIQHFCGAAGVEHTHFIHSDNLYARVQQLVDTQVLTCVNNIDQSRKALQKLK